MLHRYLRAPVLAAALVALLATTVSASVTFAVATGGFVGKGDVQTALGWTNAQLQTNSASVDFEYVVTTTHQMAWTCTYPDTADVPVTVTAVTAERTFYDTTPRSSKGKVTGFDLTIAGGSPPGPLEIGCLGDATGLTNFTDTVTTMAGLYVSGGGVGALLKAF